MATKKVGQRKVNALVLGYFISFAIFFYTSIKISSDDTGSFTNNTATPQYKTSESGWNERGIALYNRTTTALPGQGYLMSASIATDDTPNVTLNVTDRVLCFIHIGKTTDTIIIDNKNHMTLFFLLPKHNKARLVDRASDNSLQGACINFFRALGHYHPLGNGLKYTQTQGQNLCARVLRVTTTLHGSDILLIEL